MPRPPRQNQTKRSPHDGGGASASSTQHKKTRHFTTEEIVEALLAKGGIVSEAAKAIGCDRDTIYKRRNDPAIKDAIERGRYYDLDETETSLRELVREKNPAAVIFKLKTLGKERGYIERSEWTGANGGAMEVIVKYVGDDHE